MKEEKKKTNNKSRTWSMLRSYNQGIFYIYYNSKKYLNSFRSFV